MGRRAGEATVAEGEPTPFGAVASKIGRQPADKLGTVIAKQIEAEVLRGGWKVGQSLGSEQELMRRYKVSRSSLREAIRQLEIHGLVKMIRGVGGGLIVSEQPHQAAERALAIYLELLNADVDELFEARKILEPLCARLAAERVKESEIENLRKLIEDLEAAEPKLEVVVPLHLAIRNLIGEIADNPALTIFVGALNRFTVEAIAHEIADNFTGGNIAEANAHKRRIVEAIVARNAAEAESAMRADLDNRRAILRRYFVDRQARESSDARSLTTFAPTKIHPKLGQVVAMTIAHEIDREGLSPGDRLGSEPDLLTKYGVSRAVFREAIRILEVHGLVRTRRGHQGGLIVAEPDSAYTVDSAIEFLRASQMNRRHFQEIRSAIAESVSPLAAQRINERGRQRLSEALAAQGVAEGLGLVRSTRALHGLIGELCGNRALAVFNWVILELNSGLNTVLPDNVEKAVRASSQRICAAIAAGDSALARRRMNEHMADTANWTEQGLTVFR